MNTNIGTNLKIKNKSKIKSNNNDKNCCSSGFKEVVGRSWLGTTSIMYVYQAGSLGSAMNWLAITSNCKQFKLQIAKFLQLIAMNWTTSLMYIYFIFTYAYNNTNTVTVVKVYSR